MSDTLSRQLQEAFAGPPATRRERLAVILLAHRQGIREEGGEAKGEEDRLLTLRARFLGAIDGYIDPILSSRVPRLQGSNCTASLVASDSLFEDVERECSEMEAILEEAIRDQVSEVVDILFPPFEKGAVVHPQGQLTCEGEASRFSPTPEATNHPRGGDWTEPLTKTEIARRYLGDRNARTRQIDGLPEKWRTERCPGNRWDRFKIDLNSVLESDRERLRWPLTARGRR